MVTQNIEQEEIKETVKVLLSLDRTSLMLVQTGARLLASRQEMEEAQIGNKDQDLMQAQEKEGGRKFEN